MRLGNIVLRAHILEEQPGQTTIHIDASGKEGRHYGSQHFPPHELREITADQLPNGFSLSISPLVANFRQTDYFSLSKELDKTHLVLTTTFDHFDWYHPFALWQFLELMENKVLQTQQATVHLGSSEYGFYLETKRSAQNDTDLYETYTKLNDVILTAYKRCLADYYHSAPISLKPAPKETEAESPARWWTRNLVIPLAGSGVAIAIVSWLLSRM